MRERSEPNGTAILAKVDCDRQDALQEKYKIMKYPTIKTFVYGHLMKREYRGGRSEDGFVDFVVEALKEPFNIHDDFEKLHENDGHERRFVGYFNHIETPELHAYRIAAAVHRDDIKFDVIFGDLGSHINAPLVEFRPSKNHVFELLHAFNGSFDHTEKELFTWCGQRSIPLVR